MPNQLKTKLTRTCQLQSEKRHEKSLIEFEFSKKFRNFKTLFLYQIIQDLRKNNPLEEPSELGSQKLS